MKQKRTNNESVEEIAAALLLLVLLVPLPALVDAVEDVGDGADDGGRHEEAAGEEEGKVVALRGGQFDCTMN